MYQRGLTFFIWIFVWLVLNEGNYSSLVIGVPSAVLCSFFVPLKIPRVSILGSFSFIYFFLTQSIRAGFQVAYFAFWRRDQIQPCFFRYPLRLSSEKSIFLLSAVVTLLPGTLTVEIEQGFLLIHSLTPEKESFAGIRETEEVVGKLLQVDLRDPRFNSTLTDSLL